MISVMYWILCVRAAQGEPLVHRQALWSCSRGDHEKVKALDRRVAEKMGFSASYPVCGQTYSRKIDSRVLNILAGIAQSAHKFSNDIRLAAASEGDRGAL